MYKRCLIRHITRGTRKARAKELIKVFIIGTGIKHGRKTMCCWWRELTEYVGIHLEVTPGKLLSSINVISIKRSCVHEAADPYCLAQVTSLGVSRNEQKTHAMRYTIS